MRKLFGLSFLFVFVCSANVWAATFNDTFSYGGALEIYSHDYEEPSIMKNEGEFLGLEAWAELRDGFVLRGELAIAYGEVDYTSNSSGSSNDIDDFRFEMRAIGGYEFELTDTIQLTPIAGIAYRYLSDDSEAKRTTTGHLGYLRQSNYIYSPIGAECNFDIADDMAITLFAEYDYFWYGMQKSDLNYITGDGDIENDQDDGYGLRFSVRFTKQLENIGLYCEPFYRYWDIDDSDVTYDNSGTGWIEPKNETTEFGIKIGVIF